MKIEHARPYVLENLKSAFDPRTVAVVGASRKPGKLGYQILRGLLDWQYGGRIFPVNPRAGIVQNLPAYSTVGEIPEPVDLAFLAVPAFLIKTALEDCVAHKVKVAVVACSGLKEIGRGTLQDELTEYCRAHQLCLIGPNSLGLGSTSTNFCCGFMPYLPTKGPVAMISQSGANLLAGLGASHAGRIGLSLFAGLGNKADVDFSEFLAHAGADPSTRAIALYVEGLDSEEAFIETCREVSSRKPVVVLKAGGSRMGGKAAFAHTASDSRTSDAHYDDVFAQAGALRVRTWEEFLDVSLALGHLGPLTGERIVMITNGGGSGLLAADELERRNLPLRELASFSPGLSARLRDFLPPFGSVLNPVDVSGAANEVQYRGALWQALRDTEVDGVLVSICPTAATPVDSIAAAILEARPLAAHLGKVLIAEFQGGAECDQAILRLSQEGVPAYPTPERAASAMAALRACARLQEGLSTTAAR